MASGKRRAVLAGLKKASGTLTQFGERQGVNPPRSITASHSH